MNCFVVTVNRKGKDIVFPRVWAETKVDACMEMLVAVKDFFGLDMEEFAACVATAKINRDPMGV